MTKLAIVMSDLMHAAKRLGRDAFTCPQPCGNADQLMHEYSVYTTLSSYFDKARKEALASMIDNLGIITTVEDTAHAAATQMQKQSVVLHRDIVYRLELDVKTPGKTFNATKLRNALERSGRYTSVELDALFEQAQDIRAPARTFSVKPNDD